MQLHACRPAWGSPAMASGFFLLSDWSVPCASQWRCIRSISPEVNRYVACRCILRQLKVKHLQTLGRPDPPLQPFISLLRESGPVQELQQAEQ